MKIKFALLIFMASILSIAIYSTTINFVSASTECFGDANSLGSVICVGYRDDGTILQVFECTVTQNPYHVDCHSINKVTVTPGLKNEIDATVKELGPSNPNDSKDIGGMKSNNGATKSPLN
jgi:hypothetical protein